MFFNGLQADRSSVPHSVPASFRASEPFATLTRPADNSSKQQSRAAVRGSSRSAAACPPGRQPPPPAPSAISYRASTIDHRERREATHSLAGIGRRRLTRVRAHRLRLSTMIATPRQPIEGSGLGDFWQIKSFWQPSIDGGANPDPQTIDHPATSLGPRCAIAAHPFANFSKRNPEAILRQLEGEGRFLWAWPYLLLRATRK
jgi:hypothetical protein